MSKKLDEAYLEALDKIADLEKQLAEKEQELNEWKDGTIIVKYEKMLEEKDKEIANIRHQVCEEIKQKGELRVSLYDGTEFYAIKKEVLKEIEEGENDERTGQT